MNDVFAFAQCVIREDDEQPRCVQCGAVETTTREDGCDVSEPLCAKCWYRFDHHSDELYADIQFRFYNEDLC